MKYFLITYSLVMAVGAALADDRPIILGQEEKVKELSVCFDEDASKMVVEAAKVNETGVQKYIELLREKRCGSATGFVIFDRVLEHYKDSSSVNPNGDMSWVELHLLMLGGNHIKMWSFVGSKIVEARVCNDCL